MFKSIPCKSVATGNWKNICSVESYFSCKGIDITSKIVGKVGNGVDIKFWLDNWTGNGKLNTKFPVLFKQESSKKVNVRCRLNGDGSFNWKWKNNVWSQAAVNELVEFYNLGIHVHLNEDQDCWVWKDEESKVFSVRAVRNSMRSKETVQCDAIFQWNKILPVKVNIFGWRLWLNKLPSKVALMLRGINIDSVECPFCGEYEETMDHLLTGCKASKELWNAIEGWCKISPMLIFSAKDLLTFHKYVKGSKVRKLLVQSVILVTCWVIWKSRNNVVFNGLKLHTEGMLNDVKTWGFLWIKNRFSKRCFDEKQWNEFSFE